MAWADVIKGCIPEVTDNQIHSILWEKVSPPVIKAETLKEQSQGYSEE